MPKPKPTPLTDANQRQATAMEVANAIDILSHSADWLRDEDPTKARTEPSRQNIEYRNRLRAFIRTHAAPLTEETPDADA
jgi:hypothetical protein